MSLYKFMRRIAPTLAQEYKMELFAERGNKSQGFSKNANANLSSLEKRAGPADIFAGNEISHTVPFLDLPSDHIARQYIEGRMVPARHRRNLLFTDDLSRVVQSIPNYANSDRHVPNSPAILIPFRNQARELIYLQARLLEGDIRYITLKMAAVGTDAPKIWGLDSLNLGNTAYVTEGPFDAMFIENGLAAAGGALSKSYDTLYQLGLRDIVLVYDSDYRSNPDVFNDMKKSVEKGYPVVIYDDSWRAKDINSAVVSGGIAADAVTKYLSSNTYSQLQARLKLAKLRPPKRVQMK